MANPAPSYDLRPCSLEVVRDLCVRFHGYRSAGNASAYAFAVYERGEPVAGYAWQPPPTGAARAVCPEAPGGVLALSRMAAVDRRCAAGGQVRGRPGRTRGRPSTHGRDVGGSRSRGEDSRSVCVVRVTAYSLSRRRASWARRVALEGELSTLASPADCTHPIHVRTCSRGVMWRTR